jgi:predicted ATPase/DNA-binding CsgD family transcriptional regulator
VEDEEEELGFSLVDVGEYRLKDLDRPVRLFELAAAGLNSWSGLAVRADPGLPPGPAAVVPLKDAGPIALDEAAAGVHGFPAALTSFVGRAVQVDEVAGLLGGRRLVTVTGPGGAGKTRLAGEVARRLAGQFADGAWLVELAPVAASAQVAAALAAALGIREHPGVPTAATVARVLARQQLLLVLDNCEHVIGAAAELCAGLLRACDDIRILATSREPLSITGEARYRLAPLAVPDPEDLAGAAEAEAVALFTDRARSADAHFALDDQTGPAVARLVTRLDGMPLAIELAAARVEVLGVTGLLDQLDDRFALLAGADRLAPGRQRSLAAAVEWSYQLLNEPERRVFRMVSVFPGPFTLEAAELVAGRDAGSTVLRLVDCSLVVPPRPGADGRPRYGMLETLRIYGAGLIAQAGEQEAAEAALAGWAVRVAEEAAAGLHTTSGELAAARRLDAEDATVHQVLAWALQHDGGLALRLAAALGPWWHMRGRLAGAYPVLSEAAGHAAVGSDAWCAAQYWLGQAELNAADLTSVLDRCTSVRGAIADQGPSRALTYCLGLRSVTLSLLGRKAEAMEDGRQALAMARELGDPAGEAMALVDLGIVAHNTGDLREAVRRAREAEQFQGDIRGWIIRLRDTILTGELIEAGDLAGAERYCLAGLARSRAVGDLWNVGVLLTHMARLALETGRFDDAAAHLREGLQLNLRTGAWVEVLNDLWCCARLCAATGRPAEAATLWAAHEALFPQHEEINLETMPAERLKQEALRQAGQALGSGRFRAAGERGQAMSLATAAEYALMLASPAPEPAAVAPELVQLSAPERELIILVAQGRTDVQIAAQLFISVRTVGWHLDRIRDKTGCRRRADLTRLALTTGLV